MIAMGKKYQTRDGRAVRILCVDRGLRWPVLGLVTDKNGDEHVGTWDACGMQEFNKNQNLIPVPTKHEGWMPVSHDADAGYWINGRIYDSPQEVYFAEGSKTRIAHVTWED